MYCSSTNQAKAQTVCTRHSLRLSERLSTKLLSIPASVESGYETYNIIEHVTHVHMYLHPSVDQLSPS